MKWIAVLFLLSACLSAGFYAQVNFVHIPGGTYTRGSPAWEVGRWGDEGPQHQVTVSSFYMGKYEVTVGEFGHFVNATGYKTTAETSGVGYVWRGGSWTQKTNANWKNPYFNQGEKHPVVLISWYDAIEYCNWLSEQENLTPVYTRSGNSVTWNRGVNGYRLPTEAEWEYACRAGTTAAYSTGLSISTSQANYGDTGATKNVGSFAPNVWGLYDMHGNAWEWCWDLKGDYSDGAQTDPEGAASGPSRVLRGGSWCNNAYNVRSAFRGSLDPANRYINNSFGFRLVRS
ncbi:MAG: formylglycine-generating enzyme family protein [Treponema sp.]|jgi:formylglycine-generating enzyme required for sulfatase activity|nr:formylglycine-generating enzyme family protein [Treponema sp.]